MGMEQFDAIIIGSGQGGTPLAKKLAQQGWKTALIEKDYVGGTCVNVGCTPTKAMIASARAMYDLAQAGDLGVQVNNFTLDFSAVINRKNEIVEKFRNGSEKGLEKTDNLQLIYGKARFSGPHEITIITDAEELQLASDVIVIDTGTRSRIPPIPGLAASGFLTSTTIMELSQVPEHLLIIGGGYIGLEFGQMFRRFGSQVSILEASDRFLGREDEDVADMMKAILEQEEIKIYTGTTVQNISGQTGNIQVKAEANGRVVEPFPCTHILLSAGQQPNTDDLNLDSAGVETNDQGFIVVNDQLATSAPGIFAIGDVKGGPAFTHISYDDYRVLFDNLVHGGDSNINDRMVPYTMFTDPQLGRVGLTEAQARDKDLKIHVATLPMDHVARAIETGDTRGMMKAVVEADSEKILGAAIIGREGGEIMTVIQMAMVGNLTWRQLKDMIIAHPLYSESLNNLFMKLERDLRK